MLRNEIGDIFIILTITTLLGGWIAADNAADPVRQVVKQLRWFAQSAFRLETAGKVIYFDPFRIDVKDEADVVFITHSHQDHFSKADLRKVLTQETIIVAPASCESELRGFDNEKLLLQPGDTATVAGFPVQAVPMYNRVKTKFHPKEKRWLGYVVTIDGVRLYHAGDTERIPEMQEFRCDIALLPLGQTYTMNSVEEAAQAARDVRARIVVPMHYGFYEGKIEDIEILRELLKEEIEVIRLKGNFE